MCHCIFFRINPRVSKHHAFRLHRATVSSKNLSESALFILPVAAQDKIFIRYFEVGVYRGFTKKFLPVILQKYDMPQESTFLWQLYTDRDAEEENSLEKYPYHSTRGFQRIMYSNDKSVGNLLTKVQAIFDQMHCLMYTDKRRIPGQINLLTSEYITYKARTGTPVLIFFFCVNVSKSKINKK